MNFKPLVAMALGIWMAAPATADIAVNELLLRKKGEDINVRVVVGNPAMSTQRGPVKVVLYVRPDSTGPWQKIKVWNDIREIKSGDKVARDLFAENSAVLRNAASNYSWEARTTVEAPGVKMVSREVVNKGDEK